MISETKIEAVKQRKEKNRIAKAKAALTELLAADDMVRAAILADEEGILAEVPKKYLRKFLDLYVGPSGLNSRASERVCGCVSRIYLALGNRKLSKDAEGYAESAARHEAEQRSMDSFCR
jgi:hypothetical protein